jgi:hypothetical protein
MRMNLVKYCTVKVEKMNQKECRERHQIINIKACSTTFFGRRKAAQRTPGITQNEQSDISDDDREWKIKKKNGGSLVLKP